MDNIARTGVWLGLNRAPFVRDGEFTRMKNLSSDAYPYMSARMTRKDYTFNVSVKGVPGDGYEAEVSTLPEASEELDGKIYLLNPSYSGYTAGKFYVRSEGKWKEIKASFQKYPMITAEEDEIGFDGTYSFFPDEIDEGDYYDATMLYETEGDAQTALTEAKNNSTTVIRNTAEKKDFRYTFVKCFGVWEESKGFGYNEKAYNAEEMNTYKENLFTGDRIGKRMLYRGDTTDEYEYGKRYILKCAIKTTWKALEYQVYSAVTGVPETANEGAYIRYCGTEQPVKGNCYEAKAEIDADGEIFYYWEKSAASAEEETAIELPEASADSKVTKYTGDGDAKYYICEFDGEKYEWKETPQPYVVKTVTLKEYIDKYVPDFELKEISEIHAHDGEITALVKSAEDDVYLFVNKKFYKQPMINSSSGKTLTSCGRKLICGATGAYYDSKDDTYHEGSGVFSFTLQCDVFKTFSGKEYTAKAGINHITIYAEKESELHNLSEALKSPGTEFEMSGKKQAVKFPYKTEESSDGVCCRTEKITWGKKLSDGTWIEGKVYKLTIGIEAVPETFIREFANEEVYITSPERASETIVWKKRLWSYADNYLRGTIAGIFKNDVISWNEVNNNYNDSVSQPIWQGGVINAIIPLTDAIVIFKDDCITVFSGETIPTMSAYTIECPGLKKENSASAAVANDSVFYYSDGNVYRFSGGFPVNISENMRFNGTDATGGTDGRKYYLSLYEDGKQSLYVYDISKQLWYCEEDVAPVSFTALNGKIYMTDGQRILYYNESDERVLWEAEFSYDEETLDKKKYKQLLFRGDVKECEVWLKADDNKWAAAVITSGGRIKIPPVICEKLTVMLRGSGKAEIRSIDRIFEVVER